MNMNDIFQYIRDQPYPKLHILNLSYCILHVVGLIDVQLTIAPRCSQSSFACSNVPMMKALSSSLIPSSYRVHRSRIPSFLDFFSTSQCLEVALYLVTHRQESTPLTIDISDLKVQSEHKQSLLALLQSDAYVIANNVQYCMLERREVMKQTPCCPLTQQRSFERY